MPTGALKEDVMRAIRSAPVTVLRCGIYPSHFRVGTIPGAASAATSP